ILPTNDYSGIISLTLKAVVTQLSSLYDTAGFSKYSISSIDLELTVLGVADPPSLEIAGSGEDDPTTLHDLESAEDSQILLEVNSRLNDLDDSERLSIYLFASEPLSNVTLNAASLARSMDPMLTKRSGPLDFVYYTTAGIFCPMRCCLTLGLLAQSTETISQMAPALSSSSANTFLKMSAYISPVADIPLLSVSTSRIHVEEDHPIQFMIQASIGADDSEYLRVEVA
ncbi:unnamed protein product, partial [Heterosigma akashiwo]